MFLAVILKGLRLRMTAQGGCGASCRHPELECSEGEGSHRLETPGNPQVADYCVYIMASHSKVLYTGMTSDLGRRVYEHKTKALPGFSKRYNTSRLVYFESTDNAYSAITREKQIKRWLRRRKIELVESVNPEWLDLAADWYEGMPDSQG